MLKSLVDYYEYLAAEDVSDIAPWGWSREKVAALAVIDDDGELLEIIPAEEKGGWRMLVPMRAEKTSGVSANLLCDNAQYMFGLDYKGTPERTLRCCEADKERNINFLHDIDSDCARAFEQFFLTWDPASAEEHPAIAANREVLDKGGNIAFCLNKPSNTILDDPAIHKAVSSIESFGNPEETKEEVCLVTGKRAPIMVKHPYIRGIVGAQPSGAKLVSFNTPSLESYGHDDDQGLNAYVSEYAAFAYSTALNYLLADDLHHTRIGDTTIVYWALEDDAKATATFNLALNSDFTIESTGNLFGDNDDDDSTEKTEGDRKRKLNDILAKIHSGKIAEDVNMDVPFCVMGIDPNVSRLAIRFFMRDTLGAFLSNINRHYERVQIVHADYQKDYLSPWQLVMAVKNPNAKKNTAANILAGALLRSILSDSPYPAALYENALLRIRATQNNDDKNVHKVSYALVSIIKAYLLKNQHYRKEDLTMSLNEDNKSTPYLLGRLFSLLETTQEDAARVDNNKLNTTIGDRYYDAACATPAVTFPVIMKLFKHHLTKLKHSWPGLAVTREKQVGEIIDALPDKNPARLSIVEQGEFHNGYWCQRQARYKKNETENDQVEEA